MSEVNFLPQVKFSQFSRSTFGPDVNLSQSPGLMLRSSQSHCKTSLPFEKFGLLPEVHLDTVGSFADDTLRDTPPAFNLKRVGPAGGGCHPSDPPHPLGGLPPPCGGFGGRQPPDPGGLGRGSPPGGRGGSGKRQPPSRTTDARKVERSGVASATLPGRRQQTNRPCFRKHRYRLVRRSVLTYSEYPEK